MPTITRDLPVPFTVLYTTQENIEEFLHQKVLESCNDFIGVSDFEVLSNPVKISQSSAAGIYKVRYTLEETTPETGKIYTGTVASIEQQGAQISVPFNIFVMTRGKSLEINQRLRVRLNAHRKTPDGYLCVGEIVD